MRALALLTVLIASVLAFTSATPAPAPLPGPGAVIQMHRQLFAAIDRGDTQAAIGFLHEDMNVDDEYRIRPCQLWFVAPDGKTYAGNRYEDSRKFLAMWIQLEREAGGSYETEITSRAADCFSGELSFAVLDIERKHTKDGKTTTKRWRSTSLVTYDEGWKLTHMHISAAE